MPVSITLSTVELEQLSSEALAEIYALLPTSSVGATVKIKSRSIASDEDGNGGRADLSVAQARRLVQGLGTRSRKFLRFLVQKNGRASYKSLCSHLGTESLRGIEGGITQRTRTVLGEDDAYLVEWEESDSIDENEGTFNLSQTTLASLKKVLY
jgi:hypothetical protein